MRHQKRRGKFRRARRSHLGLWTALVMLVLLGLYLGVLEGTRPHVSGDRLRYDRFVSLVREKRIQNTKFLDEDAFVVGRYVRNDGSIGGYNAPLLRGTQPEVLDLASKNDIPIEIDQQVGKRIAAIASFAIPGLMLVVLFAYLILSYRRGSGLFQVRSGARRASDDDKTVTFADVAGQDAAVTELREITTFLSDPERFTSLGATVPKGILLYGPPGCGKTLMARALAGEAGAAFFSISGSDFVEIYVGVGAARVRELFKLARENAPAVVFIDELDSVGRARGMVGAAQSQGEQEQALNQILAELDGFSTTEGIIVLGATNRPDVLDQALLRPGRFDRSVGLERPNEADRAAILAIHAQGKPLDPGVELSVIANRAIGLTGADLASVINEGALLAARAGQATITQAELDEALKRILDAPERQRRLSLREKSIGKRYSSDERTTFAEVAGADEALVELTEVRDYLAEPERFAAMGAKIPRGILLSGPPGCGKTLLARAVAGEANAAFISVSGSEFVEVFAGEGASRVRELFAEARSMAPAIIFIDEIDAIGARRSMGVEGHREREQTLNQFLVELDGFEARAGVIAIAATNRPDILDPALIRPGRFDRHVSVAYPDADGRAAILALHAQGKPLAPEVDLGALAKLTRGFSGADLANVLNESALLAARAGSKTITMAIVEEGIDRATLGVASRRTLMSDAERRVVAYHEAGHALVAMSTEGGRVPHKLTIVPRASALGHCSMVDSHDRIIPSRSFLTGEITILLGGRAAEDLIFGEPSTGATSDLQRAAEVARAMVCDYGMSERLGARIFPSGTARSDEDERVVSQEVTRILDDAYAHAHELLASSRPALERVAEALLDRESLPAKELEILVATPMHGHTGRGVVAGAKVPEVAPVVQQN